MRILGFRSIPWIIAAVSLVAFVASFSELQRLRKRFGDVSRYQVSHRVYYRQFLIRSELAETDDAILFIGDSITENATLPKAIKGHSVINGGINGAGIEVFEQIALDIVARRPMFVVIALGTNDSIETIRSHYPVLLSRMKALTPNVLVLGLTPQKDAEAKNTEIRISAEQNSVKFIAAPPMTDGSILPDHVHLSADGYGVWTPALVRQVSDLIPRD